MKQIKFLRPFYVFAHGLWSQLTQLQIHYPQSTHKTVRIVCESNLYRSDILSLQDQHFYISMSITKQQLRDTPFRPSKYRTIKIYNNHFKLIIALSNSQEWSPVGILITRLLYYTKFLRNSVMRQIELNVADILLDAFVGVLRRKFNSKDSKTQYSANLGKFLEGLVLEGGRVMERDEVVNIVYKSVLYMGLFPIELLLKYSGYGWLQQKYHMFRYNNSTPWNSCLESAIKLGRDIYFDENTKARTNPNKYFIKVRLLDFFPLDNWVEEIADFILKNLENLLSDLKHCLSEQGRLGSHMQHSSEPLLTKSNVVDHAKDIFLRVFAKNNSHLIYSKIADQFYNYYNKQLFESKIFKRISNVVADSYQPKFFFSDPNQMVSSIVQIIHDNIKKIAEPLVSNPKTRATFQSILTSLQSKQGIQNFWSSYQKVPNPDFKLYTRFAGQKDLIAYIPPPSTTELIDYFGFYSDSLTKVFFENLKLIQHQHFELMWSQFKQVNKAEPEQFERRYEYAEGVYQWQEKGKLVINKKAIKSVNANIIMYMKENDQRQKEICKTLMFWYYNSIRLKNSKKYGKLLSCIGSVFIKDTHYN